MIDQRLRSRRIARAMLKTLRDEYPKLWLEIAPLITSKPAKTHIAVEV